MGYRCVLFLTAAIAAAVCFGQIQSGSIVGTVTDQSGAVVPIASVVLRNEGTGFVRSVVTNQSGGYVAYSIPTGNYTITVEAKGFQRLERRGVRLLAADTLTVDLQLSLGEVSETVEVTAAPPLLQEQSSTVSSVVENEEIVNLPLNGRSFTQLITLAPGAGTGSSGNLNTSVYAMRAPANITVNGSTAQNNTYMIDGIFNRNLWLSTLIIVPTIDAIQEFRVMTSNYSAEYGSSAGAVTVLQSKSGTNDFHGSLYEFLRNDRLDANTFFNNRAGVAKPAFRRNEFGGAVGGPIKTDKLFFFGDYQGLRIRQPRNVTATIPSLAQRQMVSTGDFSNFGRTIFNPFNVSGGQRAPFPGNRIPASMLSDPAVTLMGMLPTPNLGSNQFRFSPSLAQRTDQFDTRVDYNLGADDRIFFKYSFDDTDLDTPGTLPAPANPPIDLGPWLSMTGGANSGTITPLKNQSFTVGYTNPIGFRNIFEGHFGLVRWNQKITPAGSEFNSADQLGVPGININEKAGGLPAFNIAGGFSTIGHGNTFPEDSITTSTQFDGNLTLIRGNHTLKMGGQYINQRFDGFSAFPVRGNFGFNGQFTRQIGASGASTALADFALGAYNNFQRSVLAGAGFRMRFWQSAFFFEDSWRVNRRLTLNLGVRYELQAPPHDADNEWANFNIETARMLVAGQDGNGRALRELDTNNLGPRVGLAYRITDKTVFRSGFGISYVEPGQGGGQLYKNPPFFFGQQIVSDQNAVPEALVSDGVPGPVAPDVSDPRTIQGNINAWDQGLQLAQTISWSGGIQHEIGFDTMIDIAYVGTKGNGLIRQYNLNQSLPGPGAQARRRAYFATNPLVTNIQYRTNAFNSAYHSLQTKIRKRYSSGLVFNLSYTYSKYLSNAANINGGGNGPPQDFRCFACEWGPAPDDVRHRVIFNHVYELPFGKGRQYLRDGFLSYLAGDWDINGIWTMETGRHFTPQMASSNSNSAGGGPQRPNRLSSGVLDPSERTIERWFDTRLDQSGAPWATPAQYTFGNSGRGIMDGPGTFNVDLGIHRNFPISERFNLRFRWEMFNAFNRANFSDPNAQIGGVNAGRILGTAPARIMQAALKLEF
jgi:hypothetical protein